MAEATTSRHESNYIKIAMVVLRVSPRAVRLQFDKEFRPDRLQSILNRNILHLTNLKMKKRITQPQWELLLPTTGKQPSSKDFDITLMICLLRNLMPIDIMDNRLPSATDTSLRADLSRIKYYRNFIVHCNSALVDDTDFESYWNDVTPNQPLTGLGHLIHNEKDSRRRPVHSKSDIRQVTFMAVILKLKNKYCISVEDINELLLMIQKISPTDNILPKTINDVNRLTKDLLVPHEEHVICACEDFRFGDKEYCDVCHKNRSNGTRYYTIPIAPRIQQLREVSSLARLTTLTSSPKDKHRFVSDLHQSTGWANFFDEFGNNAIALSYCSDGFNPFHHIVSQGSYSIWAQTSLILNLPQHLRVKTGTTLLLGLISGPRAPKKLNMFNEVVVNELVKLRNGIPTFNGYTKLHELVKVGIMYMVGDVPGIAKEQNRVQQNAKSSCGHCTDQGIHSKILDKTVYPGGRKFLGMDNPMRQDTAFPSGSVENDIIMKRTVEEEKVNARYLDHLHQEQHIQGKKTDTLASAIAHQSGRYGSNHWFRLNLDLQQRHAPVEPMHAMKIIAEHIIKLLNGEEDGVKVRAEERASNRHMNLCPDAVYRIHVQEKKTFGQKRQRDPQSTDESNIESKYPKNQLPQAPYVLNLDERCQADKRLKLVKVPANFGIIPGTLFTKIIGGTKCHTWLQLFSTGIVRYCIRGMLSRECRASLTKFLQLLEEAYGPHLDMDNFDSFEKRWHEAVCMIERDFPVSLQTFYFHLLHHMPQYLKLYGPPRNFWMYPYERFNHTLTESVSNNQNPELSAIKKIEVQWLLTMLDYSGFFSPLQMTSEEKHPCTYLRAGRHKVINRKINHAETPALKTFYNNINISDNIEIFHHAETTKGMYRDCTVEGDHQRESACIVHYCNYVGRISYFFRHSCSGTMHELAWINWIGHLRKEEESQCYFAEKTDVAQNPVVDVQQLSAPLIYSLEDGIMWIPSLL